MITGYLSPDGMHRGPEMTVRSMTPRRDGSLVIEFTSTITERGVYSHLIYGNYSRAVALNMPVDVYPLDVVTATATLNGEP